MTKRLISFSEPQYEALKAKAKEFGISVSELVRRIVDTYLSGGQEE
jgi:hypothetical protein